MNRNQMRRQVILLNAIMICLGIIFTLNLMSLHLEDYWSNVIRIIGIILIWILFVSNLRIIPKDNMMGVED